MTTLNFLKKSWDQIELKKKLDDVELFKFGR